MNDRHDNTRGQNDGQAEAVTALVGEQLRAARAEVFRAYLQSRDKARALLADEDDPTPRHATEQRFERRPS